MWLSLLERLWKVCAFHRRYTWSRGRILGLLESILLNGLQVVVRGIYLSLLGLPWTVCNGVSILHFLIRRRSVEGFKPLQLI
jgi:hypothetical protein